MNIVLENNLILRPPVRYKAGEFSSKHPHKKTLIKMYKDERDRRGHLEVYEDVADEVV